MCEAMYAMNVMSLICLINYVLHYICDPTKSISSTKDKIALMCHRARDDGKTLIQTSLYVASALEMSISKIHGTYPMVREWLFILFCFDTRVYAVCV
jgi:hypothetical protein